MESPVESPNPAWATMAGTSGPLRRMSALALVGMAFWCLLLVILAVALLHDAKEARMGEASAAFVWSWLAVPVLLHVWPILALRRAAKASLAFTQAPSEDAAYIAAREQRLYWRAAGTCHLIILAWILALFAGLA